MPVITVSESEKIALQDYVDNITAYTAPEYARHFPNGHLPSTASISRIEKNTQGQLTRYVRLGQETPEDHPIPAIPLTHLHPQDNEILFSHACTVGETQEDLYFHRNMYDFPSERPTTMGPRSYEIYKQDITQYNALIERVRIINSQFSKQEIEDMQEYDANLLKLEEHYIKYPHRKLEPLNKTLVDLDNYLTALDRRDAARDELSLQTLQNDAEYQERDQACHQTYFFGADEQILTPDYYPSLQADIENAEPRISEKAVDITRCLTLKKELAQEIENQLPTQLENNESYKTIRDELVQHFEKYNDVYTGYFGPISPVTDPIAHSNQKQEGIQVLLSELDDCEELLNEQEEMISSNLTPEQLDEDEDYIELKDTLAAYNIKYFSSNDLNTPNDRDKIEKQREKISIHRNNLEYFAKLLEKQNELSWTQTSKEMKTLKEITSELSQQYAYLLPYTYLDLMSDWTSNANHIQTAILEEEFLLDQSQDNYETSKREARHFLNIETKTRAYESQKSETQLKDEIKHCEDLKQFNLSTAPSEIKTEKKRPTKYATKHHYLFHREVKVSAAETQFKHDVKFAVDKSGVPFVINRKAAHKHEYLGTLARIRQNQEFGFFRLSRKGVMKKIEFQRYGGDSLTDYFAAMKVPSSSKNRIARALLALYVDQIFLKNMVHTDLSMSNVCIEIQNGKEIVLSLIDFHESFYNTPEERATKAHQGSGSKGFLAPELFQNSTDHARQSDTEMSELIKMLKPEESRIFSPETDIYAIGCMLIDHIKLPEKSPYYEFAKKMMALDPQQRPTGEMIQAFLDETHTAAPKPSATPR